MNTYIVTAKTVEEAIALANVKYADAKHEISCEVIEMPKKGFLGIGAKEAKVKVTVAEAASADLGSIVSDMRDMKKYTDRGEQTQKKNDRRDQQKNGKPQQNSGKPDGNRDGKNDRRDRNDRRNDSKQNDRKNDAKPNADKKPAEVKSEAKPAQRSALRNGAKPNVRHQIKHVDGEDVSGASVTVSEPVGLTDFVADAKKGSFGAGSSKSGSMSNDIRRKKPAKKFMPADKTDEKMRASKYDVAESDSDYENLEIMERENEAFLEREAGAALGLKGAAAVREERGETVVPPAPPRKKEPVTQAEMDYALDFANTLLANMCINAKAVPCECPEGEEFEADGDANVYPKIEIIGEESGIIIGHHGETLDAVQYLVNLSSLRKSKSKDGDYVKIVVDTENYREKRAETLKSLARRMAAKAVKYKRNVFLEPMNAFERRIIHSELQNYPDVSTHSVGTDRDRKIIITYEGADKPAENSRPRRRRRGGRDRKPNGEQKKANRAPKLEPTDDLGDRGDYEAYLEQKRSNKIQKVPIENLTDILDGGSFIDGGNATMTTDEE